MTSRFIFLLASVAILSGCYHEDRSNIPECGAVITFVVDNNFTDKYNLPTVEFNLNYYDSMKVELPEEGGQNFSFINLMSLDENGDFKESFSVGTYEIKGGSMGEVHEQKLAVLNSIEGLYQSSYDLSNIKSGIQKINGDDYYVYDATAYPRDYDDEAEKERDRMLVRSVLVHSGKNEKLGLLTMQLASTISRIKAISDFDNNGCSSLSVNSIRLK
jgi:hypothetical protein